MTFCLYNVRLAWLVTWLQRLLRSFWTFWGRLNAPEGEVLTVMMYLVFKWKDCSLKVGDVKMSTVKISFENARGSPSNGHVTSHHTDKFIKNKWRVFAALVLLGQIPAVSYIHALMSVVIRLAGPLPGQGQTSLGALGPHMLTAHIANIPQFVWVFFFLPLLSDKTLDVGHPS